MNIVVPMAGRGSRFANHGVETPKPLIEVAGRPMVAWALESLAGLVPAARLVFVVLREHEEQFQVNRLLRSLTDDRTSIVMLDDVTEGQLCTVLAAKNHLEPDDDLLVAACDTLVVSNIADDIAARPPDSHGLISVADLPGERWSFARTDETNRVVEVAEKTRISNHASTGLYYFSRTSDFIETGEGMIARGEKTRGEYFVIPVYQKYIERGWRVDISVAKEMWDMGTPEALTSFIERKASAVERHS